jgi:MerR family copper efflux transcriptional regulator
VRIGSVASESGVTPRTVRYYESVGLIPIGMRKGGGHHHYDGQTVLRIRKINQLKELGLSLEEIASVIDLYFDDASGVKPKRSVLYILQQHLVEAEAKAAALKTFCDELKSHISRFESWLAENGHAEGNANE